VIDPSRSIWLAAKTSRQYNSSRPEVLSEKKVDGSAAMSAAVATKTHYSPEDLLAMPDGISYELVGGELLKRKMGMETSWVGGRLLSRLDRFCDEHALGWAFDAENGYQCFPHDPGLVRRPDVSFVRFGRFPDGVVPKGWAKIPPDIAVEVISPNETAYELEDKLEDYQKVGVPLIWVINPKTRTVRVHRGDGSISYLHVDEELSGEDVIPGFRCPVRDIFPPRVQPAVDTPPEPTTPNGPQ
jgi:Uma2 family endonuclease